MINRSSKMKEDLQKLGLEVASMNKGKKGKGIRRKRKMSRRDNMKSLGR